MSVKIELDWTPGSAVTRLFDLVGVGHIRWSHEPRTAITTSGLSYRGELELSQAGLNRLVAVPEVVTISAHSSHWAISRGSLPA